MILTEIKHLNVRISEFEDPIFDKNILPVFITPLILKEVEARKKSKHKIETLNPAKKLNFRVVSFNEIVEELAARINKIATDLEPHYFIDPSYYNSLPYEVRAILNKNTLKDEKKVIAEASYRIGLSNLRGKKHILYARCKVTKRRYRKGYRALNRYNKSNTVYGSYSEAANIRGENIKPILKKKNINKYRKLNFFPIALRSATAKLPTPSVLATLNQILSKIAADYSKKKQIGSYTENMTAPKSGTLIQLLQRKSLTSSHLKHSAATASLEALQPKNSNNNQLLFSGWIPTSKGALMLLEDEGWDLDLLSNKNKASQRLKKLRPHSLRELRRLRRLRRLRLMSINLYLHRTNNAKKNNYAAVATAASRGQNGKLHSNQKMQIVDIESQGRNNSNINKINYELSQPLSLDSFHALTYQNLRTKKEKIQPINLNKKLNTNKYLIKRNDNKLKFIINWIGDNLSYSGSLQTNSHLSNPAALLRSSHHRGSLPASHTQRLDKKNISEIFLVQTKKPIKLPTLEVLELPELPILNKKQEALARVAKFKVAKEKAKEKAKLYLAAIKNKYLRKFTMRSRPKKEVLLHKSRSTKYSANQKGSASYWNKWGNDLGPSGTMFNPYSTRAGKWRSAHTLAAMQHMVAVQCSTARSIKSRCYVTASSTNPVEQSSQSKANFISRLSAIKSKVNNWKKKKDLSADLLQKASQRYIKLQLQNSNLFSDTYFPVNRKQMVDNYAKNLHIKNLKKIKSLAKITQPKAWEKIASLLNSALRTPLPNKGLPKARSTRLRRSTRLFWAIIKLYSSSFNPIFNPLNNKYLMLPGLLGKSTAQIKILKNNSNNDPLSSTELTVKRSNATLIRSMTSAHNTYEAESKEKRDNKPSLAKVAKAKTTKEAAKAKHNSQVVSAPTLAHQPLHVPGSRGGKGLGLLSSKVTVVPVTHTTKSKTNSVALTSLETSNYTNNFSHLTDNKKFLFLYFIIPIFFATLKNSIAGVHSSALRSALPSLSANKVSVTVQEVNPAKIKAKESHALSKTPIMVGPWRVEKRTIKNLTNQRKQLRALIKLMLNSGSALLRSHQWIRRNRAQHYKSSFGAHLRVLQKNKTKVSAMHRHVARLRNHTNLVKNSADQRVDVVVRRSTNLLKWSVSLIAQSLAPLKRKDEYYSLIFFNILKTRGFLDLKKKTKASHLLQQRKSKGIAAKRGLSIRKLLLKNKGATPNEYIIRTTTGSGTNKHSALIKDKSLQTLNQNNKKLTLTKSGLPKTTSQVAPQLSNFAVLQSSSHTHKVRTAAQSKQLVLQGKTKISLPKKGRVKPTATELDTNKIPLITFYPGGRYISDWKRVAKVIWQEEYKFYAVYRRAKNSLKLSKINTKKKLKNKYTIITVLKLWNIIKIRSIKSVASLKLQVNFIKYGCVNESRSTLTKAYSLLAAKMICRKYLTANLPLRTKRSSALRTLSSTATQLRQQINQKSKAGSEGGHKEVKLSFRSKLEVKRIKKTAAPGVLLHSPLKNNKLTKDSGSAGSGLYSPGVFARSASAAVEGQVNFLENLRYIFIKLILNVLDTMHIKNRARLLSIKPRSLIKPANINSLLYDGGGSYLLKKTEDFISKIIKQHFSFLFYNNFIPLIKLNIFFKQREATNATNLNKKLTQVINYVDSQIPLISSIHKLDSFKKLGFLSKDISLTIVQTGANFLPYSKAGESQTRTKLQSSILRSSQAAKYFSPVHSVEFYKSYNNLVNAKLTIIGKIRSIKLVELLDKIKEANIRAEELAALKRVADITNLNLINKKKSRRINSSKYLKKKNILLSNRIKILQTIETIKTEFRFEPKLDSNALSKIPVSLLYYSNLQPLVISGSAPSAPLLGQQQSVHRGIGVQRDGSLSTSSIGGYAGMPAEVEKPPVISSFLRELSIYNRETKGIVNYFSKIVSYNFNANNNKISSSITDLLEASFKVMHCLISKPVFVITPEKVTIQLFYFLMVTNKKKLRKIRKKLRSRFNNKGKERIYKIYKKKRLIEAKNLNLYNLSEVFSEQFELLCGRLNKIFNKPVELNLIRLHYPTEDSNILVNFMDILINKVTLARIYKKLFKGSIIKSLITLKKRKYNNISIIPAFLTGLNIKIAGRIMTQKVKPRKTINLKHRGATASGKINYLNFARLTNKNKRGSYSITVSAGQNYFK